MTEFFPLQRRLNKKVNGKSYWKYYVDIPPSYVKKHKLKIGDVLEVE